MKSMYGRQFATMAGMVLLSFLLLGASFAALSYQYTLQEKQDTLMRNAKYIAEYTSYAANNNGSTVWTTDEFQQYISTVAQVADSHIIVATNDGTILFATDGKHVLYNMTSRNMPNDIVNAVINDKVYEGMTTLNGLYSSARFMVGLPVSSSSGYLQGLVFFSTNTSDITAMWRDLSAIFVVVACAVILVAAILSSVTSMHQSKPMKEIAAAARQFGLGKLDVRVDVGNRRDEIGELAEAFNSMANSLAKVESQRAEFIANVSHELKTPMTTIAGFIDGILDGTIPKEQEDKYLHIVSDEVKRLSRLVKSMLDLSRIDSGEMQLHPTNFDITNTIVTTLLTFEQKIDEKGIEIRGLEEARPQMVLGDQDLLHQVVYNLIENAVKFTNDGGAISVQVSDSIDRTTVVIENTGPGIAPEDLPMIFERFYKTDKSRSRDKNGMGLGLYIVRTILKLHGGDIAVSSAVGQFCRFEFYIPKPQEAPKLKDTGSFKLKDASYRSKAKEKKATKAEKQEREEPERSKEDDGRPEE